VWKVCSIVDIATFWVRCWRVGSLNDNELVKRILDAFFVKWSIFFVVIEVDMRVFVVVFLKLTRFVKDILRMVVVLYWKE